jgi:hypothetical protein
MISIGIKKFKEKTFFFLEFLFISFYILYYIIL